ncbi:MAG: hypothetical protein HY394_06175 [Candidatus Diapherotrites archaeon]|nr:hypothetical protein [Candidatus Diapherotrites archaeon]
MENFGFLKNRKGQASIEFIMIVLISLVYIVGYVQPNITIAAESAKDVARVGQARLAADKIASATNAILTSSGEAKETINVFIPAEATIECSPSKITFKASLSAKLGPGKEPPACQNDGTGNINKCVGEATFIKNINSCGNISAPITGPASLRIAIQNDSGGVSLNVPI